MKPGSQILCADGSIVLEVLSTNPKAGTVRAKCLNNATLGCADPQSAQHLAQTVPQQVDDDPVLPNAFPVRIAALACYRPRSSRGDGPSLWQYI